MIRDIVFFPDGRLRLKADDVSTFDDALKTLIEDMAETMYANEGLGLAATQVGVHQRVFVMDASGDGSDFRAFVNPKITETQDRKEWQRKAEGCLSFPGLTVEIPSPEWIQISAQSPDGQSFTVRLDGVAAQCAYHEAHHLDGVLMIDALNRKDRRRVEVEFLRFFGKGKVRR
jgi:peptide deformylase